jgi:hypothetical protein
MLQPYLNEEAYVLSFTLDAANWFTVRARHTLNCLFPDNFNGQY